MIVYNEEKCIRNSLKSFVEVSDEIIVVDTGSTDSTLTIAKDYNCKIIHHDWDDDFAKARNKGLAEASGQWILVLDADEILDSGSIPHLVSLINNSNSDAFSLIFYNYFGSFNKDYYFIDNSYRLFRNTGKIKFSGRIHEEITSTLDTDVLIRETSSIKVHHYGYLDEVIKSKKKTNRNLKILNKSLEENPNDFRSLYALAVENINKEQYVEAHSILNNLFYVLPKGSSYLPDILLKLIHLLLTLNRSIDGEVLLEKGLTMFPDFNELYSLKAEFALSRNNYLTAINHFESSLSIKNRKLYSHRAGIGSFYTAYQMGKLYESMLDIPAALSKYELALTFNPSFLPAFKRWVLLESISENNESLIFFLEEKKDLLTATQWIFSLRIQLLNDQYSRYTQIWDIAPDNIKKNILDEKFLLDGILLSRQGPKREAINFMRNHSSNTPWKTENVLLLWCLHVEAYGIEYALKNIQNIRAGNQIIKDLYHSFERSQEQTYSQYKNALIYTQSLLLDAKCHKAFMIFTEAFPELPLPLHHMMSLANMGIFYLDTFTKLVSHKSMIPIENLGYSYLLIKCKNFKAAKDILKEQIVLQPNYPLPKYLLTQVLGMQATRYMPQLELHEEQLLKNIPYVFTKFND